MIPPRLYIYGYLNRVQSSRRLEREAGRNIEVMWLTCRLIPDHKTIAYFRKDSGPAIKQVEVKIPAFLIAEFGHPLEEICIKWGLSRQHTDKADAQYLRLELRTRRERPGRRRAAEQSDERATGHPITSSARTINAIGASPTSSVAYLRMLAATPLHFAEQSHQPPRERGPVAIFGN
jgi:hypothetical protein